MSKSEIESDLFLNDIWSVYFHNPISNNWGRDGYIKISDISTVEDFWKSFNQIESKIHIGMFFFMREHIFPTWDDPENKDGSFISFKVLKEHIPKFSENILSSLMGETIIQESNIDKWNHVNGISFSPKKNFCIVKIWMKSKVLNKKEMFIIPQSYEGDIVFKENNM
jgi:hypothetical protein